MLGPNCSTCYLHSSLLINPDLQHRGKTPHHQTRLCMLHREQSAYTVPAQLLKLCARRQVYDLDLAGQSRELPVIGSTPVSERFCRLAWGSSTATTSGVRPSIQTTWCCYCHCSRQCWALSVQGQP